MRAGRLVALLLHVQRHGGRATAPELARSLEVSVRTIYRDIAALQEAGVPLWTEAGVHGGVRLIDGWHAPVDGFSSTETHALLVGSTAAADLGLAGVLVAAQSKVVTALPPELRQRAARVRERFLVDAPGWFQRREAPPHLPDVAEAVWDGRRLDLRYQGAGPDGFRRRVDPLGLVLKAGNWYLVAAHRGTPRTYRLSRVLDAEVREEPASRPAGFDLAEWWERSAEDFDLAIRPLRAVLRVDAGGLRALRHTVPGPATEAAVAATTAPVPGDTTDLVLPLERIEVSVHQLAGVPGIEVVEPDDLRHALAAHCRAIADRNCASPNAHTGTQVCGGTAMKSTWKAHTHRGELTTADRNKLPDSSFAFPRQRKEPLVDADHVRNAIARFDQVEGATDRDRDLAFANIQRAADHYGVEMSEKDWHELGRPS